jgi:signal transduction histidine kinase
LIVAERFVKLQREMAAIGSARHAALATRFPARSQGVRRDAIDGTWRALPHRYLGGVAALVALYYGAAHLGYAFEFSGPVAAVVWLPVGVGIAFLYLFGTRFWPGVLLGDLLVNNYSALPVGSALLQTAGNLAEVLVATALLRRFCRTRDPVETLAGVAGVVAAVTVGTALSATVGSLSSWLGNAITAHSVPYVWRTWWLGDLTGALIVLPLALSWSSLPARPWPRRRVIEATITMAAVAGLAALSIRGHGMTLPVVFTALIWAAVRFGPRGATLASTIAAGFAIWGATHQLGAFSVGSIDDRLLSTQLYIAVGTLSALSVAALVTEREQLAERLRGSRVRMAAASDAERRRLERDLHDGAQQMLVVLSARLAIAAEQARDQDAAAALRDADADVQGAINSLRDLSRGLHPAVLRDLGLAKAIAAVAGRSTVPIEIVAMPEVRFDDTSETTAYYVLLEAITNAQKHAQASRVRVRAQLRHGILALEVADDGVGGARMEAGSGLEGLRDRVEAHGGTFRLDSRRGRGTRVRAGFPVAQLDG